VVDEGSDAAAVLIGMPEFVVRAAVEEAGEVWVLVETPPAPTGCPGWIIRGDVWRDKPVGLRYISAWRGIRALPSQVYLLAYRTPIR
jgi:hypothetical protein